MARIPVYCSICKSIFPGPIEVGPMVVTTRIIGGTAPCPICGNPKAKINEGIYTIVGDSLKLLSGPEFSRETLQILQGIAQQVAAGTLNIQDAVRQAETISPVFAPLFKLFLDLGLPAMTLLVCIFSAYLQYEGNKSSSEDSGKIVEAILSRQYSTVQELRSEPRVENKGRAQTQAKTNSASTIVANPPSRQQKRYTVRKRAKRNLRHELPPWFFYPATRKPAMKAKTSKKLFALSTRFKHMWLTYLISAAAASIALCRPWPDRSAPGLMRRDLA